MISQPAPVTVSVSQVRTEVGLVCRVDPPILHVRPEQQVTFAYEGEAGASLFIPFAGVFEDRVFDFILDDGRFSLTLQVAKTPPREVREFAYGLYSRDLDDFAIGNSPPRMIIDDPDD